MRGSRSAGMRFGGDGWWRLLAVAIVEQLEQRFVGPLAALLRAEVIEDGRLLHGIEARGNG